MSPDDRETVPDRHSTERVSAPTGTIGSDNSDDGPVDAFPVHLERYLFTSYLGGGGMGRVYRAYDRELDCEVALKFLRDDDPGQLRRCRQEAQAQAHVRHERVCQVLDVGEAEGRAYIAMQFIDGVPLSTAARRMSLEERLIVLREAARGLHAAHRTGLLHRDVKPGNILVEQGETLRWKPFIVDFGIAREVGAPDQTGTGHFKGTPNYMSPEQFRGSGSALDRRADVYGLGATMYEVLCGRPPFPGRDLTEVLPQVMQELPGSLRRLDASIPAEVEAIAMKCLRKDPRERYSSARAVAEDIQRYLDGEPVLARPITWLYRLRKKAAKNRLAVSVGAAALVLVSGAAGWVVYNGIHTRQQVRLAQEFGQKVEQIESLVRYSHTAPLHDIRGERERMRRLLVEIEQRIETAGAVARGPGYSALGRGWLALGRYEQAHRHLETAWDSGYRSPELAYALGRVLGEFYREALHDSGGIEDPAIRDARRKQIERTLRDPALDYLRQSAGVQIQAPEYAQALLALYEGRYDDALEKARSARSELPWLYEAHALEGQVHVALAGVLGDRGDVDAALARFAQAEAAFESALRIGESDPQVHASLCEVACSQMRMAVNTRGSDVAPYFEKGLRACTAALSADPDHVGALDVTAELHRRFGQQLRAAGKDPRDELQLAIDAAEQALELRPDDARALAALGSAHRELAAYEEGRGVDPQPRLELAEAAYLRAVESQPENPQHLNDLSLVYRNRAKHEMERGIDPTASYDQAIACLERSQSLEPNQFVASKNLGNLHYHRARLDRDRGRDARPGLRQALRALEAAVRINAASIAAHYDMGQAYVMLGESEMERGNDPKQHLERAIECFETAIEINPRSVFLAYFLTGSGNAYSHLAQHDRNRGRDAHGLFEEAIRLYRLALDDNPSYSWAHLNLGLVLGSYGEYELEHGHDPKGTLAEATDVLRQALATNPDSWFAWNYLGVAYLGRALWKTSVGRDAETELGQAERATRRALELDPDSTASQLLLAHVLTTRVRRVVDSGKTPYEMLEESRALIGRAGELGLNDAANCEAQALRGELLLHEARVSQGREQREELLRQAHRAVTEGCAAPHLARKYVGLVREIESILSG